MLALGLVETKGFLPAVEGADAMLKSADVRLLEKNLASGGLVTITVAGEVSAVKASVEAARERIKRIAGAELVSVHVIPRPDEQLLRILKLVPEGEDDPPDPPSSGQAKPAPKADPPDPPSSGQVKPAPKADPPDPPSPGQAKPAPNGGGEKASSSGFVLTGAKLRRMSLNRLRQAARATPGLPLDEESIATADRKSLIAVLMQTIEK